MTQIYILNVLIRVIRGKYEAYIRKGRLITKTD